MAERSPVSEQPLSMSLQRLWQHVGTYAEAGEALRLSPDAVASLTALLARLYHRAMHLEMRAAEADEMEAVARDLDLIAFAKSGEIGPVELTPAGYAALGVPPGAGPAVGPLMGEVVEVDAFRQRNEARRLRERVAADQRALQAALDAGDEDAAMSLVGMRQIADTLDLVLGRQRDGAGTDVAPAEVVIFPGVRRSRAVAPDDGDAA